MIQSFLQSLGPDQHALFWKIAEHIDDHMLDVIACADYSQDADQHLTALLRLRDTGGLVEPFHWIPCEVLELIRHSEPEDPSWKPGEEGVRGHWIRAFACAALMRALGPPWNYRVTDPSYNLIRLLRSLAVLPIDLSQPAIQFIAWFMLWTGIEGQDEQTIYFGIALLWLALQQKNPSADDDLIRLSEWIVTHEEELHRARPSAFDRWLLGIASDPPPSPWESVGADLMKLDLRGRRQQLQEWVKLIGSELSGENSE